MEKYFENDFIKKYFELKDAKITCKNLLVNGDYKRAYSEYLYVHKYIPKIISKIDDMITFQEAVKIRMKEAMVSPKRGITMSNVPDDKVLLGNDDFPDNFVNMQHPNDYLLSDHYSKPEFIFNTGIGKTKRLLCRVFFKSDKYEKKYFPITFICDTGADKGFYLSAIGYDTFVDNKRIQEDDAGNLFIRIMNKNFSIRDTPYQFQPSNIIGLFALSRFGMVLNEDSFSIQNLSDFL